LTYAGTYEILTGRSERDIRCMGSENLLSRLLNKFFCLRNTARFVFEQAVPKLERHPFNLRIATLKIRGVDKAERF